MTRKVLAVVLAVTFLFGMSNGIIHSVSYARELADRLTAEKNALTAVSDIDADAEVTIMVELSSEPALKAAGYDVKGAEKYQDKLLSEQKAAKKTVEKSLGKAINVETNYTLVFNGFSFRGTPDMISEINKNPELTAFVAPVFDLPETIASTELVNAPATWEMGYTGRGTAIAILDTGILADHEAFSVNPPDAKYDEKALEKIFEQYGEYMHAGSKIRKLYESEKIPFAYDYYSHKYGADHIGESDHGTHVAGIAAGNNGKEFRGVAYDAQILAMQVFTPEGGAMWDAILSAIEDCAYLGVDALNMSLGSPAGFSRYYEDSYNEIFDILAEAGVAVSASAGNEGSTADGNAWSGYQLAQNPDSGVVGSPSTWADCLSVASSDNATVCAGSVKVGNEQFGYADPYKGTDQAFETLAGTHKYVLCGLGTAEEMENLNLNGKIAVISRGSITFTEKANNAASKGAKGVIIYNNQDGVINMSIESPIPAVSIMKIYGESLIAAATNNEGKLTVENKTYIDYTSANVISSFSSRGTTADLKIKPEITAPGGSITSSIGFGDVDSYETWSGTSMSAPHVAGGLAIIKEYLNRKFPNKTPREILEMAYAILMSTATPLEGELVRSQGAGLMNLSAAVTTRCYMTTKDGARPKLELGEIKDDKFILEFKVTNFGDRAVTYYISTNVLIDTPYAAGSYGGQTIYLTEFNALDITEDCDIKANDTITVNAGKTASVKVEVTLHEDLVADIADIFPSGTFIEGFVTLTPASTPEGELPATLSIPFLGFEGDWDYPAMIDYGYYWQNAMGEPNWYSNPVIPYNYIGYSTDVDLAYGAGINPYGDGSMPAGLFSYDRIAVSPGKSDIDYILFSLLRNPKHVDMHVEDDAHNLLGYLTDYDDYVWRKEYNSDYGYTYSDLPIDLDYSMFDENTLIYIVLEAQLDHEGFITNANQNAMWSVPVVIDSTAPFVRDVKVQSNTFTVKALDTNYIAKVAVYTDAQLENEIASQLCYSDMPATEETLITEIDRNENKMLYILVADYAQNERVYAYNLTDNTLTECIPAEETAAHTLVWKESFEDVSTLGGWNTIDVDGDGLDWSVYSENGMASDGKSYAGSTTYVEGTAQGEPYNWIITPAFTVPDDGLKYEMSFDIAATGKDEGFALCVLYPTDGGYDIADQLIYTALSGMDYETVAIPLSDYVGEEICIGWVHIGGDGYMLRLDNVQMYYLDAFTVLEPNYWESFERGDTYWRAVDNDGDGYNFELVSVEGMAHDGAKAMFSKSINTETWKPLDTDNWLISDAIMLDKAPNLQYLVLDAISVMDMGDTIEIYVGTDKSVDKMTTLLYSADANGEWSQITVDLTAYAGKTIYLGIRHHMKGGYMLGVDNIRIYTIERVKEYMVKFVDAKTNKIVGLSRVEEGTILTGMPYGLNDETYVFTGWNYDGKPITKDTTIKSTYGLRGDVTGDGKINTGDAAELLRWLAYDREMTRVEQNTADFNRDGKVNTGDAVAILRYSAGM